MQREYYQLISGVDTLDLDNRRDLFVLAADGFSLPPVKRLTNRGPMQQSETDVGYRLQPRIIQFAMLLKTDTDNDYFAKRNEILRLIRPSEQALLLRYIRGSVIREIACHYSGTLSISGSQRRGTQQRFGLTLSCVDPVFYDPILSVFDYNIGAGSGSFAIPLTVPIGVGVSSIANSQVITYPGTYNTSPIIYVTGPITDFNIENKTTGEKISVKAATNILAGDTYIIDTRFGYVSIIKQSDSSNQRGNFTDISDIATFHIAANPEAINGLNEIYVSGTGVTSATQIRLTYYTKYIGI